jgi:hypothetical protein
VASGTLRRELCCAAPRRAAPVSRYPPPAACRLPPLAAGAGAGDQKGERALAEQLAMQDAQRAPAESAAAAPKKQRYLDPYQTVASQSFSESASMMMSDDARVRLAGAKQMRETYNSTFDEQCARHAAEPTWWKQPFLAIGNELVAKFEAKAAKPAAAAAAAGPGPGPAPDSEFHVAIGDKLHSFSRAEHGAVFVGRAASTDVKLSAYENGTVSRVAVVIYCNPGSGRVLVVDVGGLFGVRTVMREDASARRTHSTAEDRNVLDFGHDEVATLMLGTVQIKINPRICVVCTASMRTVVLPCKHLLMCQACSDALGEHPQCPQCREPYHPRAARHASAGGDSRGTFQGQSR